MPLKSGWMIWRVVRMDKEQLIDFLAIYGWAILVVIVLIGFGWFYGFLSPENFIIRPEARLFNECLSCLAECQNVSNVVNSSFEVIPK